MAAPARRTARPRRGARRAALRLHLVEERLTAPPSSAGVADMGARDLETQIGRQHAPGRQHRRDARHDDPREAELAGDVGRVQPGGAAEGEEREAARIDAAAHRDEPHPLGHVGVDDAMDALAPRPAGRCRARAAIGSTARLGRGAVEPRAAAEEARRVEVAEHEIGVGDGRGGAAPTVAGRTRNGAGALRPDMQDAAGIDPGDRAAAGADAGDVEAVAARRDGRRRAPVARLAPRRSTISQMSVLVPPMSNGIRSRARRSGARRGRCRRPRRPAPTAPRRRRAAPPRRSARPRHATG